MYIFFANKILINILDFINFFPSSFHGHFNTPLTTETQLKCLY